mgnify:CR=1 FL=1
MYVGHSFGGCMHSILNGSMPIEQVDRIECGTSIPNFKALEKVIEDYNLGHDYDLGLVFEVAEYFLFRGKFVQCRLEGFSKYAPDMWTSVDDYKAEDFQRPCSHNNKRANRFITNLRTKLDAQHAIIKAKEVLNYTKVDSE